MARTGSNIHRDTAGFTAFGHDTDRLDPEIIAVTPDDPYTLIPPDTLIQEGDIKRVVGAGSQWVPIEPHEVGYATPGKGIAYARVLAPAGYVLSAATDIVGPSDLVWSSTANDWVKAAAYGIQGAPVVESVIRLHRERNQHCFMAKVDPAQANHQVVDVPPRHRELFQGEKLRTGDKLIYDGITEWITTSSLTHGTLVGKGSVINGNARFCRPIGHHHQHWYVDAANGKAGNLGGVADPWPSLEMAQQIIEKHAKTAGTAPHGTIWSTNGVPLMVYDLPIEPDAFTAVRDTAFADITAAEDQQVVVTTPRPKEQKVTRRETHISQSAGSEYNLNWLAVELDADENDVLKDAERKLPKGFRLMVAGEEVKPGDLWYKPLVDDDPTSVTWLPATEAIMGCDLAVSGYILGRRGTATGSAARAKELLTRACQLHAETGAILAELDALLKTGG